MRHTRLSKSQPAEITAQPVATLRKTFFDAVRDREAASTHFRHVLLVDHSQGELSLDVLRALRAEDEAQRLADASSSVHSAASSISGADARLLVISMSKFADDLTLTKQAECLAQIRDAVEAGSTIVLRMYGS